MEISKISLETPRPQKIITNKIFLALVGSTLALLVFLFFFLFLPLKTTYQKAMILYGKKNEIKSVLSQKDLASLKKKLEEVESLLGEAENSYKRLSWLGWIPKAKDYYLDGERLFASGKEGIEVGKIIIGAVEPYQDFLGLVGRNQGGGEKTTEDRIEFVLESINSLKPQLALLGDKIDKIQGLVDQINPERYPSDIKGIPIREKLVEGKRLLGEGRILFHEGKPLLLKVDYLLGKDKPRKYLVLFQNDGELRPTGGFWTAYGVLKVDKGKISPLVSEDIYDLDSRFNSNIAAPEPIKKYLKNVFYWHLRDMNLSPDFKLSLEQFLPYYQKVAPEKEVDGVIAVDTHVLVSLLEVLGKIGVPGWGNFSADPDPRCFNCPQVVYQLEMLADRPLPTMRIFRKGFLAPIMHSLLANAMGSPREKIAPLAKAIWSNVNSKHILFYFSDEELQRGVEKLNFAGRLVDGEEDYFHLNDSNLGGAKSNLFITQEVKHEYQRLSDGKLKKKVTVKYQNTAPPSDCNLERGNLCLNGLYRDWFRFYLPKGSRLEKLVGSEIEAKVYEDLNKTVVEGFFGDDFPLYPKGISKVTVEYELPFSKKDFLSLLIQKQPGTKAVKHEIWVNEKKQKEIIIDNDSFVEIDLH